jgi:sortase A
MFGFVAYQLWGTGIETARAQNALENEFEDLLAATPATTVDGATPDTVPDTMPEVTSPDEPDDTNPVATTIPASTTTVPAPINAFSGVSEGDPIARLEMPRIGVDKIVVAGVNTSDLKKGPGHYPETPLPGQLGNSAIAGHRTTYGQPFFDVDKLENGDEIVVTTLAGRFVYRVTGQQIVTPNDYQVVATTDPTKATLTLTSCHPKYTARERIIVFAELDEAATTGQVSAATINYGRSLDETPTAEPDPANTVVDAPIAEPAGDDDAPTIGDDDPAVTDESVPASGAQSGDELDDERIDQGIADAFSEGWFSDPDANAHVGLWGLLLAAVGVLSYVISKRAKRDWVGLLVGVGPFAITLYFFFQNVNRLLPPNL